MEGVVLEGRTFQFVRPTITFVRKVALMKLDKINEGFERGTLTSDDFKKFKKTWRRFCHTVFEKDLLWRIGFTPRELSLDRIDIRDVPKVIKGFFVLLEGIQNELLVPSETSSDSKTKK